MNIIEALKTGRRIRRKSWEDKSAFLDSRSCKDVLSDDWEVEPPRISLDEFNRAWDDATHHEYDLQKIREKLIKELGL